MLGKGDRDQRSDNAPRAEGSLRPVREERRVAAWIGASIVIKGDLISSEDMTIAGRIEGDVAVGDNRLVITPQARIEGNIVAQSVAVHGHVQGNITAEHTAEVGEKGSVLGDIVAPRMIVAEGAVLHGRVEIAAPSGAEPRKPAVPAGPRG